MFYNDVPDIQAQTIVHAPIDTVWALITEINLPARSLPNFRVLNGSTMVQP